MLHQQGSLVKASEMSSAVRLWVIGGVGVLIAGALYLWAVRGTAILLDLAAAAKGVLCF